MKYAVISDIHGNLEALNAVIERAEAEGVDRYVCVGDIVGYNANPAECLEIVQSLARPRRGRKFHNETLIPVFKGHKRIYSLRIMFKPT